MDRFYGELRTKIARAIRSDMARIRVEIADEEIYVAALVTDSDCITLYLAVNTMEYLQKADQKYQEMLGEDLAEDILESYQQGSICFTK